MLLRRLGQTLLFAWFGSMLLVGAGLLARHWVALPAPSPTQYDHLRKLAELGRGDPRAAWQAVHVLAEECRCSQQVVDHLLASARPDRWTEHVLWIGDAPPIELTRRFHVKNVRPVDLAAYGIESAPMLVAIRPDGVVAYAGGYTDSKQGPVNHDVAILESVRAAAPPMALPLFGCAISDRLKKILKRLPTG